MLDYEKEHRTRRRFGKRRVAELSMDALLQPEEGTRTHQHRLAIHHQPAADRQAMTTLQKTLVIATLVAAVGVGIYEARQASTLRGQVQELRQQLSSPTAPTEQSSRERDDMAKQLTILTTDNERLKRDTSELLKLRGEVTALRRRQDELLNQLAARKPSPPAPQGEVDTAWVQQMVNGLPRDQGAVSGALRGKLLRSEMTNVSPSEVALRDAFGLV